MVKVTSAARGRSGATRVLTSLLATSAVHEPQAQLAGNVTWLTHRLLLSSAET